MDFLKTLLAYMTLLATLGVQEGPAPETVPTPTPLPPHITASPVPHQTAAPTATAAPSTVPGPVITPNKRYSKVDFGDSGTQVKKLQNRLIELGYMPAGSADSKFGYQTYNAVKDFQKANGLEVDGIAGPATLTYLYENPNVVRIGTTATTVPTASPTQSLPPLATPNSTSGQQISAAVTTAPQQSAATTTPTLAPTPTPTPEPLVPQDMTVETAHPADLVPLDDAYIISGNDGETLYYETVVDGKRALVKLNLWQNDFGAVVSLPQIVDALDWQLQGSSANGLYTLKACGYEVTIHYQASGLLVLVDGEPVFVPEENVMLHDGSIFISEAFLRMTIGAHTIYDRNENSLVLFLTDKSTAGAQD